ncbi:uncharacterized protein BDZ99DRAFT_48245 [Mytilinidion resinicola]|uniref:Uncharacterized protein n=1 Tax=Mytilinidion resinicola TaxID=574789 RepID=A0A6A6YH66_9PEZI|nr:uncharacterized protein BDZ99DRAFT_48245 [Mytilinidion resinicola]KAF2808156.1 hypothetical protein BDZ99DRAFT_48245 [Mytilinidion resinicola]
MALHWQHFHGAARSTVDLAMLVSASCLAVLTASMLPNSWPCIFRWAGAGPVDQSGVHGLNHVYVRLNSSSLRGACPLCWSLSLAGCLICWSSFLAGSFPFWDSFADILEVERKS